MKNSILIIFIVFFNCTSQAQSTKEVLIQRDGFFSTATLGTNFLNREAAVSLHYMKGYFIKPTFAVGIATGVNMYSIERTAYAFIPVFGQLRFYPIQKKLSPYMALDAGWGIPFVWFPPRINKEDDGGYLIRPKLGLQINTKTKYAFNLELDYTFQKTEGNLSLIHI